MDPGTRRREYQQSDIDPKTLADSPFQQFRKWMHDSEAAGLTDATAMVLSTSNLSARPSQRTVLLKGFDQQGFVFFTNHGSRKGQEIEANPNVSLLFPWYALERQVIIAGAAEKLDKKAAAKYFQSRPPQSQLAAWASPQSQPIPDRQWLIEAVAARQAEFGNGNISLPDFWGGYLVRPVRFEFWQGRENRLHDRFEYWGQDNHWRLRRLAP